jgi:hypothetical protein
MLNSIIKMMFKEEHKVVQPKQQMDKSRSHLLPSTLSLQTAQQDSKS